MSVTPDDGRTHWHGCEREHGHHACALAELARLRAELAEWHKLREPANLHVNLLRGFPAQLSRATYLHLAGGSVVREALIEIRDRIKEHPAYAELTEDDEIVFGGDTAELSYLARVADDALAQEPPA